MNLKALAAGSSLLIAAGGVAAWFWIHSGNAKATSLLAPKPIEITHATPTAKPSPAPTRVSATANPFTESRRALTDPVLRQAALREARLRIEMIHGHLFQRLRGLSSEKLEELKDAMAENELALRLQVMPDHPNLSQTEMQQIADNVKQATQLGDDRVKALIGDDNFTQYSAYQVSFPFRDAVDQTTNIMRSNGSVVSSDQQEAMTDAFGDAVAIATTIAMDDPADQNVANLTPEELQLLKTKQRASFDQVLADKMSTVLDPEMFNAFMAAELKRELKQP